MLNKSTPNKSSFLKRYSLHIIGIIIIALLFKILSQPALPNTPTNSEPTITKKITTPRQEISFSYPSNFVENINTKNLFEANDGAYSIIILNKNRWTNSELQTKPVTTKDKLKIYTDSTQSAGSGFSAEAIVVDYNNNIFDIYVGVDMNQVNGDSNAYTIVETIRDNIINSIKVINL